MPEYLYKCKKCDLAVEVWHSMKECDTPSEETKAQITCPSECVNKHSEVFERIPTSFSFGTFDSMTPVQRRDVLKTRSKEHFDKHIKERKHEMHKKGTPNVSI